MRAEARGGSGEGILGWHSRAISAYTWCITEKGPQRKWLHFIKKADTPECVCQQQYPQTGEHLVEKCNLLANARKIVKNEEMLTWRIRHVHKAKQKKKGPVEPEEEEEDKLERFFCQLHEFHNPVQNAPGLVPANLPIRYAINFVPAISAPPVSVPPVSATSPISNPAVASSDVSPDYSVVSSANFVAVNSVHTSVSVPVRVSTEYSVISSANFAVPHVANPVSSASSSCIEPTY